MFPRTKVITAVSVALLIVIALLSGSFTFRLVIAVLLLGASLFLAIRTVRTMYSATAAAPKSDRAGAGGSDTFALAKLFEATMAGMREGLIVVDHDMTVIASNNAAHRLFNFVPRNLEHQRLTELTRNPAIYNAFLDALKGKERTGIKVETRDPERRVFDLRVVPLTETVQGIPQGAIGVFFDITRLERLERVRQEFLSNVSHELKTPLTAILAFVETLEEGGIDDRENRRRFLSIISKNAARMHDLIDDILELSAIEAGNVQVEPRDVELRPLVNDVVVSLAARSSARNVLVNNFVASGAHLYADPRRLEQMLTNLIDNAIKFNRKGGQVTVTYENGATSRILVKDTGDGIPAHHLDRLFERFYRIDKARSREMGGTGLGLAIVKHLAKAHGGEVSVESKLGEGSVFSIDLPSQK